MLTPLMHEFADDDEMATHQETEVITRHSEIICDNQIHVIVLQSRVLSSIYHIRLRIEPPPPSISHNEKLPLVVQNAQRIQLRKQNFRL